MNDNVPACIAVIDDHKSARLSLRALLESSQFAVIDFPSAGAYLEVEGTERIDCLVVDVHMPEMSGLELQEEMIRRNINTPLIVVTGQGDVPLAVKAMRAGAFDFLEKPFDDEMLLGSINRALAGGRRPTLEDADIKAAMEMLGRLTEREREVLNLLTMGETNKIIGHQLGISPRTVEAHRARVLEKMKARNVADLMRTVRVAGTVA
jgi:two-component system, LuxR family, response regulator FixJ